ncbi:MAG: MBL fold metallo-hydrolase [bacterium]|nr:MBL fold metallo-hydrolase [bacterium]
MKITFLGHAGFCVETQHAVVVADPWLSPTGAFDASWFQLPRNHHLGALVEETLALPKAAKFVYVSHEHEDHFDRGFLETLRNRNFTLVIPRFRRPGFRRALADYRCEELIATDDGQAVSFPGGELKLYLDDSELNRDSALLLRAEGGVFLNLNDCRIFDRLRAISEAEGAIDVLTCQFSGASWHPTCYEYSPEEFERISEAKVMSKFVTVERAIDQLRPRIFLPSAGPVCFLDPELFELNFSSSGIYRRAPELLRFVGPALERVGTVAFEVVPGDVLEVATGRLLPCAGDRYEDANFVSYMRAYAAEYADFFRERARAHALVDADETLGRLKGELERKLELLVLRERVTLPLYYGLRERPEAWLRVDFQNGRVDRAAGIVEPAYYSIVAAAWQISKVLDGEMSWENFALSFRVRLKRVPDMYRALIHAFLTLEKGDLYRFCKMLSEIESRKDRITVTAGGKAYAVNRYCPHNGGDLQQGWVEKDRYLVCPRHRWCFDLEEKGACTTNASSIFAEEVAVEAGALAVNTASRGGATRDG